MTILERLERHDDLKKLREAHKKTVDFPQDVQADRDFHYLYHYNLATWGADEVRLALQEDTRPHLFLRRNKVV